jgi:WD40 repeat protein
MTVWDATTGEMLFSFPGESTFWSLAYSPDGERLAAGDKEGVTCVWDLTTPERPRIHTLKGHTAHVAGIAFSPTGDRLVTASDDGSTRVWDAASGQELLTLSHKGESIRGAAFSPDGKHLAVGSVAGTTRIYTLDMQELVALARSRVTRSLTDEECRQYLHLDRCP